MPGMVRLSPAVRAARDLGRRNGAFAEDGRLRPGEVDHCRRNARQLAAVDEDGPLANLLRHLVDLSRLGPAVEVRTRRGNRAHARDDPPRCATEHRHAYADRVQGRQEQEASPRIPKDQRQTAGQEAAHDRVRQLGHELEEDVDLRGEERDRLIRPAALQPGQRLRSERCRAEAVDRVGRQNDRPALADRLDGLLNEALFRRPLVHVPRDLSGS